MKQVTFRMGSGEVAVKDVNPPILRAGFVLVATEASLISSGTERSKIMAARKTLVGKARSRPDQVKQVIAKFRDHGLAATLATVRNRLGRDEPIGYSCTGTVIVVADDVENLRPGDSVACAGAGYANHAEIVAVPKHLCAKVPSEVPPDHAAFVTVAAIALHGVRQADIEFGDRVLVVGLGLLGQLCAQLIASSGGVAYGVDRVRGLKASARLSQVTEAAFSQGELAALADRVTGERGFDVAVVTAADHSGDAFASSIECLRDRGRVVVVGAVGIHVTNTIKSALYDRELDVRFARSYGPGRYDDTYEELGRDYPFGFVRWTEQRNFEAVLDAMARGRLNPSHLITHRFDIAEAEHAFNLLDGSEPSETPVLGVILRYQRPLELRTRLDRATGPSRRGSRVGIGVIGAGNFAQANLLPHLAGRAEVALEALVTASGLSGDKAAQTFNFRRMAGDVSELLDDESITAVLIATRHDSHADLVVRALEAGKDVYVEKPLALDWDELARVRLAMQGSDRSLTVGFNRRHAPLTALVGSHFPEASPITACYRVNAGRMATTNWYRSIGQGGRFVGEGGHFIDTLAYLAGEIHSVSASEMRTTTAAPRSQDTIVANLAFANGSVGMVVYVACGGRRMAKERLEVFGSGKSAVLDDFAAVNLYDDRRSRTVRSRKGKGHREEMDAWISVLTGKTSAIPFADPVTITAATLAVVDSLADGSRIVVSERLG